ncbi:MAG: glycosyltransferase family 9 protein [Nitrospirae bacterium]|nr:glycosyltransferase family 9 protein [Nitrospirota bacterium]
MKIIVMPLYGIGDALMSTPSLRNIKENLNAHITYLHMFTATRDILKNNPYVDEHFHFPFLSTSKIKGLRFLLSFRGKYDISINFYPSNRRDYNLASFIIGCPVRIGHRYVRRDIRELNFLKNRTVKEDDSLHNVEENLRLLDFLGIKGKPYPLEIYLKEEEKESGISWLKDNGLFGHELIGIHPGSSLFKEGIKKRWPHEKFVELLRRLSDAYPQFSYLLFGGKEEISLRETIRDASGLGRKVIVLDTNGIRETASIMRNSRLFITNDTGLMHMASSLQIPIVAIFAGHVRPWWLSPWACKHKVVRLDVPCSPCYSYSPLSPICKIDDDYSCIRNIGVNEVFDAAVSLLKE